MHTFIILTQEVSVCLLMSLKALPMKHNLSVWTVQLIQFITPDNTVPEQKMDGDKILVHVTDFVK